MLKAPEQFGVAERTVHHWELQDGTRLAAGPCLAARLDEQAAVAVLGCEVTLVDIMAAVQQLSRQLEQLSRQLEQQSKEIGDLRNGLVERTLHDIRRTASLVMARARRSAGIAKTHEELHTHFSAKVPKALQLQAFVSKHCPGVTRSDFEEHFDKLWGKRCGEEHATDAGLRACVQEVTSAAMYHRAKALGDTDLECIVLENFSELASTCFN